MNRTEKQQEVDRLKDKFVKAQLAIVTDYKGLKVSQITMLRKKLSEKNSELYVVKNRLAKLALKDTPLAILSEYFVGTNAVTIAHGDPVAPAKVLVNFAKDFQHCQFKAATMNGVVLSQSQLEALAKLPSREELIAKLLGSMLAPAQNFVSVLAQIPRQVVNVLAAVRDKKEKESVAS